MLMELWMKYKIGMVFFLFERERERERETGE